MTLTKSLDIIIATLLEARADAEKYDSGKLGAPGTRVRKVATGAQASLKDLRALVINGRNAKAAGAQ